MGVRSRAGRRKLLEQVLIAGLSHPEEEEEAARPVDDHTIISFERYRKEVQSSFGRAYEKGEYVFQRGDAADAVYVITKGEGEVITQGVHGGRKVLTLAPGDVFGETALLEGRERRAASVRAASDLEVRAIAFQTLHDRARRTAATQSVHTSAHSCRCS